MKWRELFLAFNILFFKKNVGARNYAPSRQGRILPIGLCLIGPFSDSVKRALYRARDYAPSRQGRILPMSFCLIGLLFDQVKKIAHRHKYLRLSSGFYLASVGVKQPTESKRRCKQEYGVSENYKFLFFISIGILFLPIPRVPTHVG